MDFKNYFNQCFSFSRITFLFFLLSLPFASKAQFYAFSKSTGTYTELSGATSLVNGTWDDFSVKFKTPFVWRYFTQNITDSIEITDFPGIYFNNINNGLFDIYSTNLNSRGNNKSEVSYKTEGTAPSRILKLQFHNAGFMADAPGYPDSVNFQLWIYETSFIIEYRYGPNAVKSTSYGGDLGPYVQLADPLTVTTNFMVLEGDPANPSIRTTNPSFSTTLTGSPANGTIYRFTPSQFKNGIRDQQVKINVIQNKIQLPGNMEVNKICLVNMNGQIIQSAASADEIDLSKVSPGVYVVSINTKEGLITQKLVL